MALLWGNAKRKNRRIFIASGCKLFGKEILRKDKNFALKPKTSSDKVFNVTIALLVRNWGDWTFPLTKEFQPNSEFQLLKDFSAAIDLFSTVLIVFNCFFMVFHLLTCWKYRWPLFPGVGGKLWQRITLVIFHIIVTKFEKNSMKMFRSWSDQISFGWDEGVSGSPSPVSV